VHGEEVAFTEKFAPHIKKVLFGASLLLLLWLTAWLFTSDPLKERLDAARKEAAVLNQRLKALEERPSGLASPSTGEAKQLESRIGRLQAELKETVEKADGKNVAQLASATAQLKKQLDNLRNSSRAPAQGASDVAVEAQPIVISYDELEDRVESSEREAGESAKVDLALAAQTLLEEVREGRRKAAQLAAPRASIAPSSEVDSAIQRMSKVLEELQISIIAFQSKTERPFKDEEASLKITATSDLVESLVIPLLQAQSPGKLVKAAAEAWYLTSGNGEKILVREDNTDPFGRLSRKECDVLFTDRGPTLTEKSDFLQAFGTDMESRATGEIIALDALTLLVDPNGSISEIGPEDLQKIPTYIGGGEESPERKIAERFGFKVTKPTEKFTADAILGEPNAIAFGLYHREGDSVKARRLAWKAGPETQSLKPSPFTIATEDYRFSFRITAWNPSNAKPSATALIRFILSNAGQKVVREHGYVDLSLRPLSEQADPRILAALGEAVGLKSFKSAQRLSTNFRFASGTEQLDLKALADLERLPGQMASDFTGTKTVILGFTDDKGGPTVNGPLSVRRAQTISSHLKKAGLAAAAAGMGEQFPVDENGTEPGRARNRRSEVWVVTP
jgi:outer membrane protein OmpA-like peptidoglycan-associated protein